MNAVHDAEAKVERHPEHGYFRLSPIPDAQTLSRYYETAYNDPLRRAPLQERESAQAADARTARSDALAEQEKQWRDASEFEDISAYLADLAPGGQIVDVGAGIGELVAALADRGFDASGIEPSCEASLYAQSQGRAVQQNDLVGWLNSVPEKARPVCDAVTLLNVLEHLRDPGDALAQCHAMLTEGGILCIRVPNDFSDVQRAVVETTGCDRWWIRTPDHINYFDRESLTALLNAQGFTTEIATCDFPIDWFLLMGENYLSDPELGRKCHERRKAFEVSLPGAVRRRLYRSLSQAGFGRNLIIYARKAPANAG
ncbi:MAG: class I SAM-dependent methyltransferase [Pseudomonadota bacterium]|uniref:class I SAM-dependent methyltransferase n=1 Tax=Roseovarius TaxID=74030 RepID=UPI0022A6FBD1|nr:class I SAM-dependent methyltransferase [Roseovarius sp. EGI FJ00037]MCZ0811371.1 class I SAM-dependent methyltransferase [Roseovarius sp. EGI FJ00037]